MPNHVLTNITVTGDQKALNVFYEIVRDGVDFQKFIPTPSPEEFEAFPQQKLDIPSIVDALGFERKLEEVVIENSSANGTASKIEVYMNSLDDPSEDLRARLSVMIRNYQKMGAPSLHSWIMNHWGTRGIIGSADVIKEDDKVEIRFDTANSPAMGIFAAMGKQHPDLTFNIAAVEEFSLFNLDIVVKGDTMDVVEYPDRIPPDEDDQSVFDDDSLCRPANE